jgi:hypothetical protein
MLITGSSDVHGRLSDIQYRVNVQDTRLIVAAAIAYGVCKFVLTNSTGFVWTVKDFYGIDESVNPKQRLAGRHVVDANGNEGYIYCL